MNHKFKGAGESIVEVLLAFTILAVVTTSVLVLFQQSLGLKENIRNREIALYLAQEGIEGVRNIRDTNWLRFSGDKRKQWMCLKSIEGSLGFQCDDSTSLELNQKTIYQIEFPTSAEETLALKTRKTQAPLFTDEDFETSENKDLYDFFRLPSPQGNPEAFSPFFRFIELTLQNPYQDTPPEFCNNLECKMAKLSVRSVVGWREEKGWKKVTLETTLFDYLDRSAY